MVEQLDTSVEDLIDSAVATGDEHAIKFTEACLREHALNPKPVYLAAARDEPPGCALTNGLSPPEHERPLT